MFRKKILQVLCSFLIMGFTLQAQDTENPEQWTLQNCVDYAIKNNIQVRQSGLNVEVDRANLTQSRADLLPNLNANADYRYNVGRSVNPFTNIIVDEPVSSQSATLSTSVTLFNGFQKTRTIKRNKIAVEASSYLYQDVQNDVTLQVITAYMNILLNNELLDNAKLRLLNTEMQLDRTSKLVDAGSLPESNLLEIKAQNATNELEIINAQNNIEIAKLNLKQLLQLPGSEPINIVVPEIDTPDEEVFAESLSEIYNTAVEVQPDVKAADAIVESAEYDVGIAQSNRYPNLTANAFLYTSYSSVANDFLPKEGSAFTEIEQTVGYLKSDPTQEVVTTQSIPTEFTENTYLNQLDFNLRRGVSVNLDIPIFNGWQTKTAISRARINKEIAEYDAVNIRNTLRQNIEQAYLDVLAAQKRFTATKVQVEALQEAFRVNEQRFNLGAINSLDYNLALTNLNVAESDLVQAKYDYVFKTKILDFYQGKSISF